VDYANEHLAVTSSRTGSRTGPRFGLRLYPVHDIDPVRYSLIGPDGKELVLGLDRSGTTAIEKPVKAMEVTTIIASIPQIDMPIRVVARSGEQVLLDVELPLAFPKADPEHEAAIRETINPNRSNPRRYAESLETRAWVNGRGGNLSSGALRAAMDWAAAEPSNIDAQRQLGRIEYIVGRFDKAVAALNAALAIDPNDAQSHHLLGLALLEQKQNSQALRHFNQAIQSGTGAPEAHYMAALASIATGDSPGAIAHLRTLVQANPNVVRPRIVLAALLARQGAMQDAKAIAGPLVALDPASPEVVYAWTLCDPQNPKAAQDLAKMLNKNPEAPEALAQLKAEIEQGAWVHPARPDVSNVSTTRAARGAIAFGH
jgi:tetratricopeptide (TPR) repeat protein